MFELCMILSLSELQVQANHGPFSWQQEGLKTFEKTEMVMASVLKLHMIVQA